MNCEPTSLKPQSEIDIPALRAKYEHERDKRLRPEMTEQYVRPVDQFTDAYEVDPHMPVIPRA